MRIKGKTAWWFWLVYGGATGMTLYGLIFSREDIGALVLGMVTIQAVFLPIMLRNYVMIEDGKLTVYFGFGKESIPIEEIVEVRRTCDPIASSAASLDRLVIKSRRQEVMCSVCEKDQLFQVLLKCNPNIKIN